MKGDHRRTQLAGRSPQTVEVGGMIDPASQRERRSSFGRQQVPVAENPEDLAMGPDHGYVPDVPVEHLQHHLAAKPLGGHGEGREAHHLGHRRIDAHASGHHPIAQIMVGQDSQLAIRQTDEGRRRLSLGHPAGRLANGVARLADDRPFVHEPRDRLLSRVEVSCRRGQAGPRASEQAARHVAHSRRAGKQWHDRVRGQPIAERVLGCPSLESGG